MTGVQTCALPIYNGSGVLQNVAGGSYTIQRVFFNPFTGRCHVYYGQNTYNTLADARANLASDSFSEAALTAHNNVFVAYLIVKAGTSDLTNTADNTIVQAGLFRNTVGSSGGTTFTQTLDDLSDVTITSATNGQALIYNSGTWINGNPTSASYASTSSIAISASYALTASYALNGEGGGGTPGG